MGGRLFSRASVLVLALILNVASAAPVLASHKDSHDPRGRAQSGKERSDENGKSSKGSKSGNSGTQGKSQSDPDGDSNGGADKPGGSGGVDRTDQDGNNGCGNDDDFEDDNNGLCGGNSEGNSQGKITICHATGSATNPYVLITISVNGLNGHDGHDGDIIPAPEGGCPEEEVEVEGSVVQQEEVEATPTLAEVLGSFFVKEDAATAVEDTMVLGSSISAPSEDADAASPAPRSARVLGAVLPFTGAGLVWFLVLAAALLLGGLFLTRTRSSI
jgi:hypothetical protein